MPVPGLADVENDRGVGEQPDDRGTVLNRLHRQVDEQTGDQRDEGAPMQGRVPQQEVHQTVECQHHRECQE